MSIPDHLFGLIRYRYRIEVWEGQTIGPEHKIVHVRRVIGGPKPVLPYATSLVRADVQRSASRYVPKEKLARLVRVRGYR